MAVPAWADFFTQQEYTRFIGLLDRYFSKNKIEYVFDHGPIVQLDEDLFGLGQLGLVNLAQMAKQTPGSKWKRLIAGHFDSLQQSVRRQKEFDEHAHDFNYASKYLGVRLYHNDYVANIEEGLRIGKPFTEDVFALLVFDFPDSVTNVKPEQTIQWNKTYEELFQIGLNNIRGKYPFTISKQDLDGITVQAAFSDHFFTPNILFHLNDFEVLKSSKGILVALPHRHAVLLFPIRNIETITAINKLIPVVNGMFESGPGSISDSLYWYIEDHFIKLPYELDNQHLRFFPPPEFVNVLNELPSN